MRSRNNDDRIMSLWAGPHGVSFASWIGWAGPQCSTMPPRNQGRPASACSGAHGVVGDHVVVVDVRHGAPVVGVEPVGEEAHHEVWKWNMR